MKRLIGFLFGVTAIMAAIVPNAHADGEAKACFLTVKTIAKKAAAASERPL